MSFKITVILAIFFLFMGCVDKTYKYHSTVEDINRSSSIIRLIKEKEHLYEIETILTATYFFSIETAKELLSKEVLGAIAKVCKKKHKRYFSIISPKEVSNSLNSSLVNTLKEFVATINVKSIHKEERNNRASIKIEFLLLDKRASEYIVWDSEKY